jgi:heme/copper-type cytochrome/quinol oxidase subunit 2
MEKHMAKITRFNSGLITIIFILLTLCLYQSSRYTAHMAYHISPDYLPYWFHVSMILMLFSMTLAVASAMVCICWTTQKEPSSNPEPVSEELINRWEP